MVNGSASSGPRLDRRPMVSPRHTHTWRTSTMSSRTLSPVLVGIRGVPCNYTTGWIICRSIDCRSNECRSNDCRSNDCRINGTTPKRKYDQEKNCIHPRIQRLEQSERSSVSLLTKYLDKYLPKIMKYEEFSAFPIAALYTSILLPISFKEYTKSRTAHESCWIPLNMSSHSYR